MNLKEFVRLNPKEIRRDNELMQLFVNFYEAAFSFTPKCVGCSFNSGFKKLKKYAINSEKNIKFGKTNKMSKKTFQLKSKYRLKILTYKKDGKIYRSYGYNLTEDFAKELVKAGKSDLFVSLPNSKDVNITVVNVKDIDVDENIIARVETPYDDLDYRTELIPMYTMVKERTQEEAKTQKKKDIIAFLQEHEG